MRGAVLKAFFRNEIPAIKKDRRPHFYALQLRGRGEGAAEMVLGGPRVAIGECDVPELALRQADIERAAALLARGPRLLGDRASRSPTSPSLTRASAGAAAGPGRRWRGSRGRCPGAAGRVRSC